MTKRKQKFIVWWKHPNVIWSHYQLREIGLIDHLLKPQYRPYCIGQLRLWIDG